MLLYVLYITAFLNVALGIFTFINRPRSRDSFYFFLFTVGIAGWASSNAEFQRASDVDTMYLWAIVAYQVTSAMLFFGSLFTKAISIPNQKPNPVQVIVRTLCLLFGVIAPSIPNFVALGVDFDKKEIIGGPFLPLLFLSYLILMGDSLINMVRGIRDNTGNKKTQLATVFTGFLGAILSGITTNLLLPAFGIYSAVAFGPTFTLINLILVVYAILRHRLFDIRLLLGRVTYYFVLSIFTLIMYYGFANLYENLFNTSRDPLTFIISVPSSIVFVIFFSRLDTYMKDSVTSRIINPVYNPTRVIESLNTTLAVEVDLARITQQVLDTLAKTIRSENNHYVVLLDNKVKLSSFTLPADQLNAMVKTVGNCYLALGNAVIAYDEIVEGNVKFRNIPNITNEVKSLMEKHQLRLIMPLGIEQLNGFVVLGTKEADFPYSDQDIRFLSDMGKLIGAAVERSLLYEEVQEFNRTLQHKVDEATVELKTANEQLSKSLEEIQELRRQERDMIDVMGHELRTPISIVRNAALMLQTLYQSNNEVPREKAMKYVDMAVESARREVRLIETLLSATKIDGNRIQLDFTKVDLLDVINDGIEANRAMSEEKKLPIVFEKPNDPVFVYADRVRIQEVADNFISNAVKYTLNGEVRIKIQTNEVKKMVYTSVIDTGMGIGPDDLSKLGRKFFRAKQYIQEDATASQKVVRPGGTGLGLYVVFELIKLMNGEKIISSEVGKGSNFTFGLPLYTGQADQHFDQTFLANGNATTSVNA